MRPCSKRLVTRLRRVARRCQGLRPSLEPDFKWRIGFLILEKVYKLSSGAKAPRWLGWRPGLKPGLLKNKKHSAQQRCTTTSLRYSWHRQKCLCYLQVGHVFCGRRWGGLAWERGPDDAAVLVELHAQA